MVKERFKGIIFDLDGTLADTLEDIAGSMNRILKAHGYAERPVDDYKLLVGRGLDNLVKQALPESVRQPDIISACLKEMIEDYSCNCLVKTRLYKGISELLYELQRRKIKTAVFSNKAEPLTIKIINHLAPGAGFVNITGAREGLPKKPDPSGALNISYEMNIPPHEIIYTGDSDVDMKTAVKAGMYAAGVSWGFRSIDELRSNGADLIIDRPDQLLTLF